MTRPLDLEALRALCEAAPRGLSAQSNMDAAVNFYYAWRQAGPLLIDRLKSAEDKLRWLEQWEATEEAQDPIKANRVLLLREEVMALCDERLQERKHAARTAEERLRSAEAEILSMEHEHATLVAERDDALSSLRAETARADEAEERVLVLQATVDRSAGIAVFWQREKDHILQGKNDALTRAQRAEAELAELKRGST